eukprot:scaffold85790_cov15-Tisochrysis_lutea.AAC.1
MVEVRFRNPATSTCRAREGKTIVIEMKKRKRGGRWVSTAECCGHKVRSQARAFISNLNIHS